MKTGNYDYSARPLEAGTLLKDGQYEIIGDTVDAGGFGRIYRAYGSRFEKNGDRHVVAIKEFHINEFLDNDCRSAIIGSQVRPIEDSDIERWRNSFYRETEILAKLNEQRDRHVPWVHAYNHGKDVVFEDNGRLFYAMTFIDGKTLTEIVESEEQRSLCEEKALYYIIQIAKVLHKAHNWKLMHCDISPNNIMIQDDFAILVDFGNAMSYDIEWLRHHKRSFDTSLLAGTPGYCPPPQYIGSPQGDIYSLAATLYYFLTGEKIGTLSTKTSKINAIELLRSKGVSDETIRAIMNVVDFNSSNCTTDARKFLSELPQDIVLDTLLNYNDSNYNKL